MRVKVGDTVILNAGWTTVRRGIVTDVHEHGFRVQRIWFGWHELASVESVAPPSDAPEIGSTLR